MIGADEDRARWLADSLTEHFDSREIELGDGVSATCGISFGSAAITGREEGIEEILERADRAMYEVKAGRKSRG